MTRWIALLAGVVVAIGLAASMFDFRSAREYRHNDEQLAKRCQASLAHYRAAIVATKAAATGTVVTIGRCFLSKGDAGRITLASISEPSTDKH